MKTFRRRKHWTRNRMEARKPLLCLLFFIGVRTSSCSTDTPHDTQEISISPENESKDEKLEVNDLNSHQIFNSFMVERKTRKVNFGWTRKKEENQQNARFPQNLIKSEAQRIH